MEIRVDDLSGPAIADFLDQHLRDMYATTPPESVHALDLNQLRSPDITFWIAWENGTLLGCGALRELGLSDGEIKSMRTAAAVRGRGIGTAMLRHILTEARQRGYARLWLETGSQPFFAPARRLYERFGFAPCGPFGAYVEDPCSVFMSLNLTEHIEANLASRHSQR